ncbi:MAG: type II toxin-antitoxin system HicB family antitoxin [Acidimicrobiia bacterium]|nr:type II toxin-antitoxin system HicB family antitoxin [Acidimicrobiia bacterium]
MTQATSEELQQPVEYTVAIERSPRNYAAWEPDLPSCVATADSREHVLEEIREAISFHIESMREHGEPIPEPRRAAVVDAAAAPAARKEHPCRWS